MDVSEAYRHGAPPRAILVHLDARADLSAIAAMPRGPERKAAAWRAIEAAADASQGPLLAAAHALEGAGLIEDVQQLASPNMLIITPSEGHGADVVPHFQRPGVESIWRNDSGGLLWSATGEEPAADSALEPHTEGAKPAPPGAPRPVAPAIPSSWGIAAVGAPEAWRQGATGAGMVYGSIDTGVQGMHEALREGYRGWDAASAAFDSDYNYYDGSGQTELPKDFDSHGTHTTATAVGRGGIGVAPGAEWIATRNSRPTADSYLKQLQWMQAPTREDGSDPDGAKAPDVVGMSWTMGRAGESLFQDSLRNLIAAGIEPIKSAGNDGPWSNTITSPGHLPEAITVSSVSEDGSTDKSSSRGPGRTPTGADAHKPDIAAPGENIVSAVPSAMKYDSKSGTSMAQPHVAGAALILLGKYPQLTHDQLVQSLAEGAHDLGAAGWDTTTGAGMLDIPASLDAARRILGKAGTKAA